MEAINMEVFNASNEQTIYRVMVPWEWHLCAFLDEQNVNWTWHTTSGGEVVEVLFTAKEPQRFWDNLMFEFNQYVRMMGDTCNNEEV